MDKMDNLNNLKELWESLPILGGLKEDKKNFEKVREKCDELINEIISKTNMSRYEIIKKTGIKSNLSFNKGVNGAERLKNLGRATLGRIIDYYIRFESERCAKLDVKTEKNLYNNTSQGSLLIEGRMDACIESKMKTKESLVTDNEYLFNIKSGGVVYNVVIRNVNDEVEFDVVGVRINDKEEIAKMLMSKIKFKGLNVVYE